MNEEVVFAEDNSGRWLFQPGVWRDHRDYAYAGWQDNETNLHEKKIVDGIAQDSSHSHRWPLWLISLQRGYFAQGQIEKVEYIYRLRQGLAKQFLEIVLASAWEAPHSMRDA